jgi:CRP-like cAMP-binding protein
MYIIRSGKVAIKKRVAHGEITVAVLEKGDFFGEMAMLEHIPRTAGAEIIEDGDLIVIGSDIFGDMVKSNPEIGVRMLRKYSLRLRETTKQIEELPRRPRVVGSRRRRAPRSSGRCRRRRGRPRLSRPRLSPTSSPRRAATSSRCSSTTRSSAATTR